MTLQITAQVLINIFYVISLPIISYVTYRWSQNNSSKSYKAKLDELQTTHKSKCSTLEAARHLEVKELNLQIDQLKAENIADIEERNRVLDLELEEAKNIVSDRVKEIEAVYKSTIDDQNASLELYEKYIKNFDAVLTLSSEKLADLDSKGVFNTDDEIGFFFDNVKYLQDMLNNFKIDKELLDSDQADEVK